MMTVFYFYHEVTNTYQPFIVPWLWDGYSGWEEMIEGAFN